MRRLIVFIIFLIIIFVINLIFYFLSDDYRFFLRKVKDPEQIVYLEEKTIDDEIKVENNYDDEIKVENNYDDEIKEEEIEDDIEIIELSKLNEKIFELKDDTWVMTLRNEVTLWKNYTDIIELFSIYKLKKLEMNSNLFDITNEYPDNYFEYYWEDLTLYLFPTKTYIDLLDIFSILDDDLPFSLYINWLNEWDNVFWEDSFYINLNEEIKDRFVRLVISHKWVVFWLKIKQTEYGLVKDKLKELLPADTLPDEIVPEQEPILDTDNK